MQPARQQLCRSSPAMLVFSLFNLLENVVELALKMAGRDK
jgi:hypothetical protein